MRHLFNIEVEEVPGEEPERNLWWFGAIVYMTGSILINLGSNIIRYSHERIKHFKTPPPIYKRFWWILGFAVFGIGNVFNFIGFMFAAQSLLVALGSIQFISNLLFAKFVNKEPITKQAILATAIIICGNIVIVLFGSKSSETYDLDQLFDLFIRPAFLAYISTVFVLVIALQILYLFIKYKYYNNNPTPHAFVKRFIPVSYACVSAMIGTTSVTIGKSLSGLLLQAFEDLFASSFVTPWPYLLTFLFVVITVFWLYRMNNALKLYDAMFIIPVLQALWLLFAVLGGGIFFEEFANMKIADNFLFALGIFILLCGVSVFSPRPTVDKTETAGLTVNLNASLSIGKIPKPDPTKEKEPLL